MKPQLTIIIPFKNEGIEVYNTVESLLKTSELKNNLILINDASSDDFDYRATAEHFDAKYVEHKSSLGVAESREHGISLCETEFFIFFDAHMRAYTQGWDIILLNHLKKEERTIFCCATIAIERNSANIISDIKGYGVTIDLSTLSYTWNNSDTESENATTKIPCIMGASYASNVAYWNKLKGLKGLCCYGYDEQFISIKVALEGGCCRIIKDIVFGHMFRVLKEVPYIINVVDVIYNQLFIAELLYPNRLKGLIFRHIRCFSEVDSFDKAIKKLESNRTSITDSKEYYKKIFSRDFTYIEDLNTNKL